MHRAFRGGRDAALSGDGFVAANAADQESSGTRRAAPSSRDNRILPPALRAPKCAMRLPPSRGATVKCWVGKVRQVVMVLGGLTQLRPRLRRT